MELPKDEFYYYKVPSIKDSKKEIPTRLHVIGVIDSSGSMSSYWKDLSKFWNESIPKEDLFTMCFDTRTHYEKANVLSQNIHQYGGGGTKIPEAFQDYEKHLEELPLDCSITTIFISDGEDNDQGTLNARLAKLKGNPNGRKINFICLGIENGFPTFLSMKLRQLYHKGEENIPALYLIEYASEKAFFNKFEGMSQYFKGSQEINIEPPVLIYPWEETVVETCLEGNWLVSKQKDIVLNQTIKVDLSQEKPLNVDEIIELTRQWVQNLQLLSLKDKKQTMQFATVACSELNRLVSKLSTIFSFNLLEEMNLDLIADVKVGFYQRSKMYYMFRYGDRIIWFKNALELLAEGSTPSQESSFEAAKQLNVGTVTGKYHQKVLALKQITGSVISDIKNQFLANYTQKLFLGNIEPQAQNGCLFEALADDSFSLAMELIKNPYDLVNVFPLQGHKLKVKRNKNAETDCWDLTTKDVLLGQFIALPELAKNNFVMGDEINCLLPVFTIKETQLHTFAQSRLFHQIMSIAVSQNYDTFLPDAYKSLAINCLICLLLQKEINFTFIESLIESLEIAYSTDASLVEDEMMFVDRFDEYVRGNLEKAEFLQRSFLAFLRVWKKLQGDVKQCFILFKQLITCFCIILLKTYNLSQLIVSQLEQDDLNQVREGLISELDSFFSLSELRKSLPSKYDVACANLKKTNKFSKNLLFSEQAVPFAAINKLGQRLFPQDQEHKVDLVILLTQTEQLYGGINKKSANVSKDNNKLEIISSLEKIYIDKFRERHINIALASKDEIIDYCLAHGIKFQDIEFGSSELPQNCCYSPTCPFYLKVVPLFKKHLDNWQGTMPSGFHRFVVTKLKEKKNPEQIGQAAKSKWKKFPADFKVNEEFVTNYIVQISEQLAKLKI